MNSKEKEDEKIRRGKRKQQETEKKSRREDGNDVREIYDGERKLK